MKTTTLQRGSGGTLAASCLAILLAQFANVIPAPINGDIQSSLHANGITLSWITSAFLLPTAIFELSFGVLGDKLGRRRILLVGAAVLVLGSLITGSARDTSLLIVGQAIGGIGAGALIPTSLAIAVASAHHDARRRSRNVALWTLWFSLGTVAGIMVSGALAQSVSWHASFYSVAVLAAISLIVTALFAGESSAPEGRSLDWAGQTAIAIGLFCVLFGIVQGAGTSWSPGVIAVLAVGVLGLVAFFVIESRTAHPMLHLTVFKVPAFSATAVAVTIGMFSFLGNAYALSIRVGNLQGHTGLSAAAFFIVLQGVPCVLGPVLPRLMRELGARRLVTIGLALLAAGEFWLASIPLSATSITSSVGPLLIEGVGFLVVVASMTDAAVSAVPASYTGMASAAISTVRDFGMCTGPAVVSAVALRAAANDLPHRLAALPAGQAIAASHAAAAGGPFAVLSNPSAAFAGLQSLAHGYSLGFAVCGGAALLAAVITAVWLRESADDKATVGASLEVTATA